MKKKFLSVIIVSLNTKRDFLKTLKSCLNQNKKDIEIIVIDGKSTDGTVKEILKYKKKIFKIRIQKDKGIYDAMNIGIRKSKGQIIGILNADDIYYKNALKIVKKYFQKNNIDFLFGTVRKDRVLHGFWPDKIKWKFNIYPSHSGGFFITKKAQKKIGLYNLKFRYSSDRDLIYRMIVKHKLNGICTKKSEILAKFDLDGVSSRIGFFNKLLEETRIRLHNKQNFLFVTMLVLAHSLNKLLNLIVKR